MKVKKTTIKSSLNNVHAKEVGKEDKDTLSTRRFLLFGGLFLRISRTFFS